MRYAMLLTIWLAVTAVSPTRDVEASVTFQNPVAARALDAPDRDWGGQAAFAAQEAGQAADDDEPDVLLMALLTVGVAGAAAVLALIGYGIRNRIGFWLHRPPPREGGVPEDHH